MQSNAPIQNAIDTARSVSRDFNQQVVQVAKDQALQTLQSTPPNHVVIDAAEHEPNDDILNANVIDLGKLVKASIGSPTDNDFYTFTTPKIYRDWIRIEVQNQSTTLDPNLELFDASKTSIGGTHNTTAGGDLTYEFVAPPETKFTVRVSSYYARNTGVYLIRVSPEQAYDSFEPNDDILSAKPIKLGEAIKANIMDKDDADFYSVDIGAGVKQLLTIQIANGSASLHPNVVVFDGSKTQIGDAHNATPGGDLTYDVGAAKGPIYVRVSDYYVQNRGDYTLTIIAH